MPQRALGGERVAQQVAQPRVVEPLERLLRGALQHAAVARDNEVRGGPAAADQPLTHAGHCVDHHAVPLAGERIDGEHDARRLRIHHALYQHGHAHAAIGAHPVAVGLHPLRLRRGQAAFDRVAYRLAAANAEHRFELTGERSLRAVFAQRREAHRDRRTEPPGRLVEAGREVAGAGADDDEPLRHAQTDANHLRELRGFSADRLVADAVERDKRRGRCLVHGCHSGPM
jgi:hypothetical protein